MYDDRLSPIEGGHVQDVYDEPLSASAEACLTCMMSRYRQMRGHV